MNSPRNPLSSPQAAADLAGERIRFGFDNTYARLPENFYARVNPTPVEAPRLVKLNEELAQALSLDVDALRSEDGVAAFRGQCDGVSSDVLDLNRPHSPASRPPAPRCAAAALSQVQGQVGQVGVALDG